MMFDMLYVNGISTQNNTCYARPLKQNFAHRSILCEKNNISIAKL